jgi:hypothetical protein
MPRQMDRAALRFRFKVRRSIAAYHSVAFPTARLVVAAPPVTSCNAVS